MIDAMTLLATQRPQQKTNFDQILRSMIADWQAKGERPKIMIHSCCAPCSTTVLEYLAQYADLTIFFANSNIHPRAEYEHRSLVQQKFIRDFNQKTGQAITFIEAPYEPAEFIKAVSPLREAPEGGERCHLCYEMRLDLTAQQADALGYDYFCSALTLSPQKNSQKINAIGLAMQADYRVNYLPSDFKKNNGYKRSVELCHEYAVYRQCYCGCIFAAKAQGVDLKAVTDHAKDQIPLLIQQLHEK